MRRRKITKINIAKLLNVTRAPFPEITHKSIILMEKKYTEANDSCIPRPSLSSKIRRN